MFDVEKAINNGKKRIRKRTFYQCAIFTIVVYAGLMLIELFRLYAGRAALLFGANKWQQASYLLAPIVIGGIFYLIKLSSKRLLGVELFKQYAKYYLKQKSLESVSMTDHTILSILLNLKGGKAFKELSDIEKHLVLYAITQNFFNAGWMFSKTTFKKMAKVQSEKSLCQIINQSTDQIVFSSRRLKKFAIRYFTHNKSYLIS